MNHTTPVSAGAQSDAAAALAPSLANPRRTRVDAQGQPVKAGGQASA